MSKSVLIPEAVRKFIQACVKSTWGLEILLLLRASRPRAWTALDLSARIRGNVPLVQEELAHLVRCGLVADADRTAYRYDPKDHDVDAVVARLARLNDDCPLSVVKEIIRVPNEKLQVFVDGFRIRKE